jgi:hypothetical protein
MHASTSADLADAAQLRATVLVCIVYENNSHPLNSSMTCRTSTLGYNLGGNLSTCIKVYPQAKAYGHSCTLYRTGILGGCVYAEKVPFQLKSHLSCISNCGSISKRCLHMQIKCNKRKDIATFNSKQIYTKFKQS